MQRSRTFTGSEGWKTELQGAVRCGNGSVLTQALPPIQFSVFLGRVMNLEMMPHDARR
jgi:hypothetical protein